MPVNLSLKQRVQITVGILITILLTVTLSIDLAREYQARFQALEKRGAFLADFAAGAVAQPLWVIDPEEVRTILAIISNSPDFLGAVVINEEGDEVAHGQYPFPVDDSEVLLFERDVEYSPELTVVEEKLGTFTLAFSTRGLNEYLEDQIITSSILLIVLIALNMLVIQYGAMILARPFRQLIESVYQFSGGQYGKKTFGLERKDEVADIANALEVLRLNLLERDQIKQALEESNQMLEQRVAERTEVLATEVEERKRAEQRALAADQAKGEFLANMSHEIRTPMNAVLGLTHLALQKGGDGDQQDYLNKINMASKALLGIINDILDFSKIEAGQLVIEQLPFNLRDQLGQVFDTISVLADPKGLEVKFDIAADLPPWLQGDSARLRQILLNLINNAVKFTDQGAVSLTVWGELRGKEVQVFFKIEDSGIGMSERQLDQLFRPFTQADHSTARKYGGTGLGLAISKQLVEMMEGEITVDSAPGEGSCFRFHILSQVAAAGEDEVHPSQLSLHGKCILLVEDNELNQQVATEILEHIGAEVVVAHNGVEAVDQVKSGHEFALVLMDLQMPLMDGYEATEKIRELPEGKTLPIIAMTANAMQSDRKRTQSVGMDDFLSKPIDLQRMYEVLSHYTGERLSIRGTAEQEKPQLEGWPDLLPGLNVLDGVRRLMGRQSSYQRVVRGFSGQIEVLMSELQAACARQEGEEGRRVIHSIKGIAANISAQELAAYAAEIERVLDEGGEIDQALLTHLNELVQIVNGSIDELLSIGHDEKSLVDERALDHAELIERVEKLKCLTGVPTFNQINSIGY